jgi:hypothetical protein
MALKNKRISLVLQAMHLSRLFPGSSIKRYREEYLIWQHTLTPSPCSDSYKIKLHYLRNNGVKFYVVEPKLKLFEGQKLLPHVFSTPKQRLCLYYPNGFEWNVTKLFVDTIVPWACEWLLFYELWLITGKWLGGGIGHKDEAEKKLIEKGESTKYETEQKSSAKNKK